MQTQPVGLRVLHAPKASAIGDRNVPELEIRFDEGNLPVFADTEAQKEWFFNRALVVVNAMEQSAPGGFMDALLTVLLMRKAIVLHVPDKVLTAQRAGDAVIAEAVALLPDGQMKTKLAGLIPGVRIPSRRECLISK